MQRGERQERDCQLRETESDMALTIRVRENIFFTPTKASLTV